MNLLRVAASRESAAILWENKSAALPRGRYAKLRVLTRFMVPMRAQFGFKLRQFLASALVCPQGFSR
jgi:hypothetical protein